MIIKFWDNEDYDYPLIRLLEKDLPKLKELLKEYQKSDEYNYDDFIIMLEDEGIILDSVSADEEIYF